MLLELFTLDSVSMPVPHKPGQQATKAPAETRQNRGGAGGRRSCDSAADAAARLSQHVAATEFVPVGTVAASAPPAAQTARATQGAAAGGAERAPAGLPLGLAAGAAPA